MKKITLPVAQLETCERVRVRAQKPKLNSEPVQEYAEAYECGLITEPLDVFREKGTERYIVADGENRLLALQRAKIEQVECRLHEGDEVAALDFAIGCNQAHGLRRTKADRYHAFVRIMETELRDKYRTDTELSEKIGVSVRTIATYKADWRDSPSSDKGARRKKQKAKDQAAAHTSEPAELQVVNQPETKGKPKKARTPAPQLTAEHKRNAKQVRESLPPEKPEWGPADEHAYKALKREWARATPASREKFLQEVR